MRIPALRIALVAVILGFAGSGVATAKSMIELKCPIWACYNPCIDNPLTGQELVCPPMHWPPP